MPLTLFVSNFIFLLKIKLIKNKSYALFLCLTSYSEAELRHHRRLSPISSLKIFPQRCFIQCRKTSPHEYSFFQMRFQVWEAICKTFPAFIVCWNNWKCTFGMTLEVTQCFRYRIVSLRTTTFVKGLIMNSTMEYDLVYSD